MRRFTTLFAVLVAVMFVAAACGKKTEEAGEKKAEKAEKVEKAEEPAAEAKPEEPSTAREGGAASAPAADEKAEEPSTAREGGAASAPAADEKAEEPAAEEKAEEPSTAREGGAASAPAAEAKPEEPAAKAAPKAVNPHSASADNLLVATYEVPALDDDTAKKLTLALADRDGVVSAKADQENGLFKVTYSSGCPHSMEGALKGVVADAKLQGVTAREGDAPAAGCGGCANKATCGGHDEHH